jgi:SAM-dependent methyltransferase
MSGADSAFVGAIPQLYDDGMGPTMFQPYAADLAARLAGLAKGRLLETAAGTGIVTTALAAALPGVEIVATDLNQPMLDRAAAKPGVERVIFRQADALALPFEDASFDAVVCQFGVMFFPDRVAAYREARRVLKLGGRFLFNVWCASADNPAMGVTVAALSRRYPNHGSWFIDRVPCGYRDPGLIRADLEAAGFPRCRIETVALRGPVVSPPALVTGLCQGSPLRADIEANEPDGLQRATDAVTAAFLDAYGSGPYDLPLLALVIETAR